MKCEKLQIDKVPNLKDVLLCTEYVGRRTLPNLSDTMKPLFDTQNF